MAKKCLKCSKEEGFFDVNYAGFDINAHVPSDAYPERMKGGVLPGSKDKDFLCSDCASTKFIIECTVHGVIEGSEFSGGISPACPKCRQEYKEAKKFERERSIEEKKSQEAEKKAVSEAEKAELSQRVKSMILSTSGPAWRHQIVGICFGFSKERSYIGQYEAGLELLKVDAARKKCDAVVDVRIVMMEGHFEGSSPKSLTGAIIGGLAEAALEGAVFKQQIPKDGVIFYGTGIRILNE